MIDIKTQYAGLTLRNPIIVGSSGLTNKAERNRDFEKAGAGAIVLKSLFEEQIEMQSEALMQDSDYPEAADYIQTLESSLRTRPQPKRIISVVM